MFQVSQPEYDQFRDSETLENMKHKGVAERRLRLLLGAGHESRHGRLQHVFVDGTESERMVQPQSEGGWLPILPPGGGGILALP